jgi:hypothetical protein
MRSQHSLTCIRSFALATIAVFAFVANTVGQAEKVLHNFQAGAQAGGSGPQAALVMDSAGNLYGTTFYGGTVKSSLCSDAGAFGCGTAFELSPSSGGGWTEKTLHNFGQTGDGADPAAAMIFDAAGNLYGTTSSGGSKGCGTVFELIHQESGAWSEKVLYSFCSLPQEADGSYPDGELIFDKAGNLYGTASEGGTGPCKCVGVVFELSPGQGGGWTEQVLHNFGSPGDGANPAAGLVFDHAGNLFGTTGIGGSSCNFNLGCGTVFELTPQSGGTWTEKVLYIFTGSFQETVAIPNSTPVLDAAGNLYGTTSYAPETFQLTPNSDGSWTEKDLPAPCCFPNALTMDSTGNLYATASSTTGGSCCGSVFELVPQPDGRWTGTVLFNFPSTGQSGAIPLAGLIFDKKGNLYGTTSQGGTFWHPGLGMPAGTVFKIIPAETVTAP